MKIKYNKFRRTEKPIAECPHQCSECEYFEESNFMGTCKANGFTSGTYGFSHPRDRCLPLPLNCYWWYASAVWRKVSEEKQEQNIEERIHMFIARDILKEMLSLDERKTFASHLHRAGGGGIIDFELYPQSKQLYEKHSKEYFCEVVENE